MEDTDDCFLRTPLQLCELFMRSGHLEHTFFEFQEQIRRREEELSAVNVQPCLDALWCELDNERALLEFGINNGFRYPFLRGLPFNTPLHMGFEKVEPSNDMGFWLTPNLDTLTVQFSELLQLTNFVFAPPKVVK
jgi:hypothetical protein